MKVKKTKKIFSFSVVIERDEAGYFVGSVPSLRSCYTQAKTLPELYKRLQEVVKLSFEMEKELFHTEPIQNEFLGVQKLEFSF